MLESVASSWSELWNADPRATPFQSPAWLIPWARQFVRQDLFVLGVRNAERLVALVPAYIYDSGKERRLLLLGAGTTDYLDALFDPEFEAESLALIEEELKKTAGLWDSACFFQLRASSPLLKLHGSHGNHPISPSECCFRISANLEALPSKLKRNLGYYQRRAGRRGTLSLDCATEQTASETLQDLLRLHQKCWTVRGHPGVLADERVRRHHRESIPLLQAAGLLRLLVLRVDHHPIAAVYALADSPLREHRAWYAYVTGFDPDFNEISPGTLLFAAIVEEAHGNGAEFLDFLRGEESYKKLWGARPSPTYAISWRAADASHPTQRAA